MSTTPNSSTGPGVSGATPDLSYEQAREELMKVVQRLESGGVPLDESLALWERGEHLATMCQQWLDGAKAKIEAARSSTAAPD